MSNSVKSTPNFRCKAHEPIFNNFKNSYLGLGYHQTIINYGGRASGKSHAVADNTVFWLPERPNDVAVYITYSAQHKSTSALLIEAKLIGHGYQINQTNHKSGDITYKFGNNNYIIVKSMETSSIDQLGEKFKNFELPYNCKIKLIAFEEFTACLNVFRGDLTKFHNILSSFNRHMCYTPITIYTTNPPPFKSHIFYKWLKKQSGYKHFTTLYDLPDRFVSKMDLINADRLKVNDIESFRYIYLGDNLTSSGMAFDMSDIYYKGEGNFIKYYVQSDEATSTATTYSLFGIDSEGLIVLISNKYYPCTSNQMTQQEYANDIYNWLGEYGVPYSVEIGTDSILFALELEKFGFTNVLSVANIKDRVLSYKLAKKLNVEGSFKITNKPENNVFYIQMENAEKEIRPNGDVVVNKKYESQSNQDKHCHTVDTLLYLCLRLQRLLLGVE